MNYYKHILYLLILISGLRLQAQDIHFSQYTALPATMNPALTGFIPGENAFRLGGIYRNQWSSFLGQAAFSTYGVAIDMRNCFPHFTEQFYNKRSMTYDEPTWGLGMSIVRDETGVQTVGQNSQGNFPLTRDYIDISTSGIIPANNFYLMLGFKFGGVFSRIETAHLRYDEQFDGVAGFDGNIVGEFDELQELNSQNLNLSGGAAAYYLTPRFSYGVGFAVDHIFLPIKYNFINSELPTLTRRFTAHAKINTLFLEMGNSLFGLSLSGVMQFQQPYMQSLTKIDLLLKNDNDFNMTLGLGMRNTRSVVLNQHIDALITGLSFNLPKVSIGANYDLNVSNLSNVSYGYGALEIFLNYRWNKKRRKKSDCAPHKEGCLIFL